MRRKPVMVVGVAAIVLGVGVLAAGQAGAEEASPRPDGPRPGFAGAGRDSGPQADDHDYPAPSDVDDPEPVAGRPESSDVDYRTEVHHVVRAHLSHGRRPAADQPDSAPAAHVVRKGRDVPDPAVTSAPGPAEPPAAMPSRPMAVLSQQDAGGSMVVAAKARVTASDISVSPGSPVQQQILALINLNRRQHGCARVRLDRRLIGAANAHAADMARHNYFAHESRDGTGAGDRVTHAGFTWRRYSENIARGEDSPYAVVDGWMHSPEHRQNILDCAVAEMGIGVAIAGDRSRTVYWVQDFATAM